jgi:hypothetical protein
MTVEKIFDTPADLCMTDRIGRIGMHVVKKQMPIGSVGGLRLEEITRGDRCFGSGPFDRRIDHRHVACRYARSGIRGIGVVRDSSTGVSPT